MSVDEKTLEFFRRQQDDPANKVCADSGTSGPQWASVSHGIYIGITAAGAHRSLGVGLSFVQSIKMDAWKPLHLKMMELGGNRRFCQFLEDHGVPKDMPIREKYQTRVAEWYREQLRALASESMQPEPLTRGVGHLPMMSIQGAGAEVLDRVFYHICHNNHASAESFRYPDGNNKQDDRRCDRSSKHNLSDLGGFHENLVNLRKGRTMKKHHAEEENDVDFDHSRGVLACMCKASKRVLAVMTLQ